MQYEIILSVIGGILIKFIYDTYLSNSCKRNHLNSSYDIENQNLINHNTKSNEFIQTEIQYISENQTMLLNEIKKYKIPLNINTIIGPDINKTVCYYEHNKLDKLESVLLYTFTKLNLLEKDQLELYTLNELKWLCTLLDIDTSVHKYWSAKKDSLCSLIRRTILCRLQRI